MVMSRCREGRCKKRVYVSRVTSPDIGDTAVYIRQSKSRWTATSNTVDYVFREQGPTVQKQVASQVVAVCYTWLDPDRDLVSERRTEVNTNINVDQGLCHFKPQFIQLPNITTSNYFDIAYIKFELRVEQLYRVYQKYGTLYAAFELRVAVRPNSGMYQQKFYQIVLTIVRGPGPFKFKDSKYCQGPDFFLWKHEPYGISLKSLKTCWHLKQVSASDGC